MSIFPLLVFSVNLLQLVLCSSASGGRPSVVFLHGRCEGEDYSTEELGLEEAARVAAEDVSACSETPIGLTPIATPAELSVTSDLDVLLETLQLSLFNSSLQFIAVVYPGCSSMLQVVANVLSSTVYQIPLLTYSFPELPSLTFKTDYHIHMTPNEAHLLPAIIATVNHFGWQRVAVLTENKPVFNELHISISSRLESEDVIIHHQMILDSTHQLLDTHSLFSEDVKIFVLNMNPGLARVVLCQALHTLKYPGYVWITHGWYMEGWWEEGVREGLWSEEGSDGERSTHTCTGEQLAAYLDRSIGVSHYPREGESERAEAGSGFQPSCLKSSFELATEFHRRSSLSAGSAPSITSTIPDYINLVYDAVWTAATAYSLSQSGRYQDRYQDSYQDIIDKVQFYGTSGPVAFRNGSRDGVNLTLIQYRMLNGRLKKVPVASLTPSATAKGNSSYDIIYFEGGNIWPDGIPLDGTPIEVEHFPFPAVMGVVYSYSILGVIFALACLVFNLVFRKKKLIKLTSPNLNNIIVLGAIICYLSGLTFFYPRGASITGIAWGCNLRPWATSVGFSVCYGTLNVKMWRVYAICRKPKPSMSKTLIKDYHLMLLVLVFVMVDTIILVVVMSLDNSRFTVTTIPNKQDTSPHINEDGIKEVSVVSRCLSKTEPYWISILFGYKAIIQIIGLYLAFKIRKIKISGLNDSREVSIALYVTSIIVLVILVTNFVFGDYIDVDGFVYGFGLSTAVTVVLSLTFFPKMVSLYRDPEGKHIFKGPATNTDSCLTDTHSTDPSEVSFLHKRIKQLEKQVELARNQDKPLGVSSAPCYLSMDAPPNAPPLSSNNSAATTNDSIVISQPLQTLSE